MQDKTATLLGHNENMTFNVADCFLLRIHKSADSFNSLFLYQNLDRIKLYETEMQFLQFLDSKGFCVQSPVCDKNGCFVAHLPDGTAATALSWIDGCVIEEDEINEETCFEIGTMIGNLHNISACFEGENVLRYDAEFCDILKNKLCNNNVFTASQFNSLVRFCDKAKEFLNRKTEEFVFIHGDLSFDNIVQGKNGLVPIDFSLFGFGHPMMDVSCMLGFVEDAMQKQKLLEGYLACGRQIDFEALSVCCAVNELVGILLHIDKLQTETWFENWLDGLCERIFAPVIDGENIYKTVQIILRVTEMEQIFDEISAVVFADNVDCSRLLSVQNKVAVLESYYTSAKWKADFAADEQGLLPQQLKRGILSEDGIYNLLCENDRLLKNVKGGE